MQLLINLADVQRVSVVLFGTQIQNVVNRASTLIADGSAAERHTDLTKPTRFALICSKDAAVNPLYSYITRPVGL